MSKRLQVICDEGEYRLIRRQARLRGVTVSEWVRQALRAAMREQPSVKAERKLAAVRAAARHAFPAPDIDRMLEEIERGYRGGEGA